MYSSGTEPYDNKGGSCPPPSSDDGDSLLNDGECCPFSPLIDGVDKEEDRLCGASSWSLHTDRWSLRTKEGGGSEVDDHCRVHDDKNDVEARGKEDGIRRHPPPSLCGPRR